MRFVVRPLSSIKVAFQRLKAASDCGGERMRVKKMANLGNSGRDLDSKKHPSNMSLHDHSRFPSASGTRRGFRVPR